MEKEKPERQMEKVSEGLANKRKHFNVFSLLRMKIKQVFSFHRFLSVVFFKGADLQPMRSLQKKKTKLKRNKY